MVTLQEIAVNQDQMSDFEELLQTSIEMFTVVTVLAGYHLLGLSNKVSNYVRYFFSVNIYLYQMMVLDKNILERPIIGYQMCINTKGKLIYSLSSPNFVLFVFPSEYKEEQNKMHCDYPFLIYLRYIVLS